MGKTRLEAFSDAVIAIIITIMVLEIKVPHGSELSDLYSLGPIIVSYIMSFVFLGIYWNNHHHMLHASQKVNGSVLWANMHLLFWLSLIPFVTGWMGENHFAPWPTALYGIIILMAGVAYYILSQLLIKLHGKDSTLAKAVGSDIKGMLSVIIYATGIPLSFVNHWIALSLYIVVTIMWFIPDPRIEKVLKE